jgi:8-oxo-dGTP pyrophosphatase MutT (NUDIX family)
MGQSVSQPGPKERRQVAALPWRRAAGGLEILLITSRETRRWVTPKGGRMAGKTDAEAAAQEALEEAGVEGAISERPLGSFRYLKVLKRRASRWCTVDLYGLEVTVEHPDWQERDERQRVWLSRGEAAQRVDEPDLRALISGFEPEVGQPSSRGAGQTSASPRTGGWAFWRRWLRL